MSDRPDAPRQSDRRVIPTGGPASIENRDVSANAHTRRSVPCPSSSNVEIVTAGRSGLARFIEATGGHLRIVAVYDDTEVDLAIGDITADA